MIFKFQQLIKECSVKLRIIEIFMLKKLKYNSIEVLLKEFYELS